mmetsp:Transcript_32058/g.79867  ORF Transcript_32058/g.79867 Transcript_32058/m.79867 type:complete len:316 (-) Transcript_32058:12-959(-)
MKAEEFGGTDLDLLANGCSVLSDVCKGTPRLLFLASIFAASRRGQKSHALHLHRPQCERAYFAWQKPRQSAERESPLKLEAHSAPLGSAAGMGASAAALPSGLVASGTTNLTIGVAEGRETVAAEPLRTDVLSADRFDATAHQEAGEEMGGETEGEVNTIEGAGDGARDPDEVNGEAEVMVGGEGGRATGSDASAGRSASRALLLLSGLSFTPSDTTLPSAERVHPEHTVKLVTDVAVATDGSTNGLACASNAKVYCEELYVREPHVWPAAERSCRHRFHASNTQMVTRWQKRSLREPRFAGPTGTKAMVANHCS